MEMTKGYYYDYRRVKPRFKPVWSSLLHDVSRLFSLTFGYRPRKEKKDIVLDASTMQIGNI